MQNQNPIQPERINALIDTIRTSDKVSMRSWQCGDIKTTFAEFHACGNEACIGGHLALSKAFQALGGIVTSYGRPDIRYDGYLFIGLSAVIWYLVGQTYNESMKPWGAVISAVIYGNMEVDINDEVLCWNVPGWIKWRAEQAIEVLSWLRDLQTAPSPIEFLQKMIEVAKTLESRERAHLVFAEAYLCRQQEVVDTAALLSEEVLEATSCPACLDALLTHTQHVQRVEWRTENEWLTRG